MPKTDKRSVLKRIASVRQKVVAEIGGNSSRGRIASGLASEGFAGGYLAALDDVEAALTHGWPSDHRGYWKDQSHAQD